MNVTVAGSWIKVKTKHVAIFVTKIKLLKLVVFAVLLSPS